MSAPPTSPRSERKKDVPDLSPRTAAWGLVVVTVLALILRLSGLGFMLPHFAHIDERVYANQIDLFRGLERVEGETDNYGFYPELVPWLCSLTTAAPDDSVETRTLSEHRRAGSEKVVELRFTVAWLSVLLVPATYFLVRRFARRRVALTASCFIAMCVLHLWHAQQARPHAVLATTTIGAVLGALLVLRRGDWRAYMIAGLASGMAIATLQSGFAVLPALCVAHLLRPHERGWRAHVHLFVALAICVVTARVFYPFVFDTGSGQIALGWWQAGRRLDMSGHGVQFSEFNGEGFAPVLAALWNFDPLLGGAFVLGVAVCVAALLMKRVHPANGWREILVVLAHALPYLMMIGMWQRSYQRFLLPLIPYIAWIAAIGLWWAGERLFKRREWATALVAAVVLAQGFTAFQVMRVRRADDTATEAANWIAANIERTDRIAVVPMCDMPLMREDHGLAQHARSVGRDYRLWARYQSALPREERERLAFDLFNMPVDEPGLVEMLLRDPVEYVRALKADYAVVQEFGPEVRVNLGKVRDAVRQCGTLVARFTPWREDRYGDTPLLYYWDSEFAAETMLSWRVLAMKSLGAPVEVYRLK